jgi:hypothetical protein
MALLSRDWILAAEDLKREEVHVPEWGGSVMIGTMTGAQRDAWEQSLVAGGRGGVNIANVRARLVVFCAVDEHGARVFQDADAEALGAKSAAALERCARVAMRLNGLTDSALEEARGN